MDITRYTKIYFLGAGGIGMSALARYFNHQKYAVYGYDKTATPLTRALENEGIQMHYEDWGERVSEAHQLTPDNTLVIRTPAVPSDFNELQFLQASDFTIVKRAEVLGLISRQYKTIAVAGTHGKTTTSTLIAHMLHHSGKEVLAFLGGISTNYNSNLMLPSPGADPASVFCVVEADEYDRSFLHLHPWVSIITSTDADHLDIYGDKEALEKSFNDFAANLQEGGLLIYKKGLPITGPGNSLTYSTQGNAGCHAANITIQNAAYHFDFISASQQFIGLQNGIPGWHNTENAIAAIAATLPCGLTEFQIREGLQTFKGVKRRFEYILNEPGMIFIDDYAHHPQELRAIISSVKELYPERKLTGIFQPHLFSRTRDFAEGFSKSLNLLDEVILLDIYPAREKPIPGVDSALIGQNITKPLTYCDKESLSEQIRTLDPALLLTLGAGDIDALVQPLKDVLFGNYKVRVRAKLEQWERDFPHLQFLKDEPMARHTWLKIGGPADIFFRPRNHAEILDVVEYAIQHEIPFSLLGNGSNLLVSDKGIRGIVIAMGEAESYMHQQGDLFRVSASYSLPKFVLETLKLGYEGLESTAGIPCTVGGATRMNAGAYGTEVFDCIHSVTFIRNGKLCTKEKKDIQYRYRHTEFEKDVILETTFELRKAKDIEATALKRKELLEKRKVAQPLDKPNTGSVFKNPLPLYAGKLIEEAGLKGFEHGHVQVSPKHANFIVNNGGATATEFMELVEIIKDRVREMAGVELQTEVLFTGEK